MTTPAHDAVLSRLGAKPGPNPNTWKARCPTDRHKNGDRHPSLGLVVSRSGWLSPTCFAHGCTLQEIAAACGTKVHEWGPEREEHKRRSKVAERKIVATYDYQDKDGNNLYQVVRYDPKDFKQRRKAGQGSDWTWNLNGVELVPYNLHEIYVYQSQPVIVVEGEKDAEALKKLGLLATTSPGGAGKWLPTFGQYFRGRRVAIIPDNDEPGQAHAMQVAGNMLYHSAASVRIVHLPGLPEKGDVSDFLGDWVPGDRVATDEAKKRGLVEYIRAAPEWRIEPRATSQPPAREVGRKAA